jgi:hypothetical protein
VRFGVEDDDGDEDEGRGAPFASRFEDAVEQDPE